MQDLTYTGFLEQLDMQVFIAVGKDILSRVVVENQSNLINHLYCVVLDIKKLDLKSRKYLRKTRIVNLYDNKIGKK